MDELMTNPALADVVDPRAMLEGGQSFAQLQQEWLVNREAALEAIRSAQSVSTIGENGHVTSHFQIGEEGSPVKILLIDTDAWIDPDGKSVEGVVSLAFKGDDPLMVYELYANQYTYREIMTSGNSKVDLYMELDNGKVTYGKTITVIDGQEQMRAEVTPTSVYVRGPKGALSTTVRETWTGKTRYQEVIETAEGQSATITFDFYEDGDSLVCDLYTNVSDDYATFKISRIDKLDIEDLSASDKINEITVEQINAALEEILKAAIPMNKAA